jgi:hypothetical protein
LRTIAGVVGATAPPSWHRGPASLVEAFPASDGAAPGIQTIIDRANATLKGTGGTLTGVAAVDRDFLHALFGSFPYALALLMIVTLILLTRAFRSIVLAIKAVLLNLLSLVAAFGIVVFVFQQGHGSSLWNIDATQSVTAWIPVMIFAFLCPLARSTSTASCSIPSRPALTTLQRSPGSRISRGVRLTLTAGLVVGDRDHPRLRLQRCAWRRRSRSHSWSQADARSATGRSIKGEVRRMPRPASLAIGFTRIRKPAPRGRPLADANGLRRASAGRAAVGACLVGLVCG